MKKWPKIKLGECIESIRAGVSFYGEPRQPEDGEVGILTLGAVSTGRFDPNACKSVPAATVSSLGPSVRQGTLLMSRSNTVDLVGSTVFVEKDYPDRYLPDLLWEISLWPDSPLEPAFLADYLGTPSGRRVIQSAAMGTSGSMKKLSMRRLRRLEVPLIPCELQEAWGTLRQKSESIARRISNLITAKREFKRGLMQELLTGRRRFPEFDNGGHWEKVRLGEIVEPVHRPVEWDDDAHYRRISIRRRNGGFFLREIIRGAEIKTKRLFTVKTGDLVLSRMQVVHGAIAVVPSEFDGAHVSGMYLVLQPKQPTRVRTEFLHYLFHLPHMYQLVLRCCYGVHIEKMTFNPDWFFRSEVLIPPTLDEQDRIITILSSLSEEIDLYARLQDAYQEQQRGLMQKLLTGELTIPVSCEPEPTHV